MWQILKNKTSECGDYGSVIDCYTSMRFDEVIEDAQKDGLSKGLFIHAECHPNSCIHCSIHA
jgi:hypothetical protein